MTFIPLGIWYDAPGISVGLYIWKGLIPALLGNILGGGLFVGAYFWYQYIHGTPATPAIDGQEFAGSRVGLLDYRGGGMVDLGRRRQTDVETLHGEGSPSGANTPLGPKMEEKQP